MTKLLAATILSSLVPLVIACQDPGTNKAEQRDPRRQPLTLEDAIYTIPGVTGRILVVGDFDADGRADFVVERGDGRRGYKRIPKRLDAVSTLDGHTIRTLWTANRTGSVSLDWDAGEDIDGDGISDLIIGMPKHGENETKEGKVLLISGSDGRVIYWARGSLPDNRFGFTVAFLGDVNDDGTCDYAVGAPESNPWLPMNSDTDIANSTPPGSVHVYSGRRGVQLWKIEGTDPGLALGTRMEAVGDVDGDGRTDLLIGVGWKSSDAIKLVSGVNGQVINEIADTGGRFGAAGDLDGDGTCEVFLEDFDKILLVSQVNSEVLFELKFADWYSNLSTAIALGDIDGDGVPDFLLGEPNFNIKGEDRHGAEVGFVLHDVRTMNLQQALDIETDPFRMGAESGTAWVYSGRTQRVILGVWGAPGSLDGLGFHGAAVPDLNGDGFPEIAVVGYDAAYVFVGPGADPDKSINSEDDR